MEADDTVPTISPTAAFEAVGELAHLGLALLGRELILPRLGFPRPSRAFCSDTILNFSTAPATSPTSRSLRPRPGSTTEKSPPASFSIAAVNARMGRAMLKTEKMHTPIRTSATSYAGDERGPRDGRGLSFGFGAGSELLLLGKVDDLVGQLRYLFVDRRQHLLADAVDLGHELCERRCRFAVLLRAQGELLLADRFDLLLPLAEIADQHDQAVDSLVIIRRARQLRHLVREFQGRGLPIVEIGDGLLQLGRRLENRMSRMPICIPRTDALASAALCAIDCCPDAPLLSF